MNTKPVVKLIKKADRQVPELAAETESPGPNRWSTAVEAWVSGFQEERRGGSLPVFDSLFKDEPL
jgi:hypothetical protein